jgi:hypothetical protein
MRIWQRLFQSPERAAALKSIPWGEVTRIEAARVPATFMENSTVVLWCGDRKLIEVTEDEKGYKTFRAALLREWPQIEGSLNSVFTGPAKIEEHVTLWTRPDAP